MDSEQPTAPYLDAVVAYAFRGPARYHVPGHKGGPGADPGLRKAIGEDCLAMDIPQDIHGIDLGPSPTPYERAERLAADAYGAARTFFLTNGATQGNHTLCLALAPLGATIVAQRNSHASVVDGLVLSGGIPSFVAPEYDAELGITHCVTPAALEVALRETPAARAAFIVSPTYYGMAADIFGMAEVAHAAGVPLIVDQSWGPHFGFNEALPPTALSQGADAMLTSTHKIAGSLTQSAMLHLSDSGRVDIGAVSRALRLLRSTSPSALLMASLDAARRQLSLHGEQILWETLQAIEVARAKFETIPGIALVDAELVGQMGVAGYDPLRIVLDVRGTGRTGYEIADALRRSYDVHVELPMQATVVFIVGLGESAAHAAAAGRRRRRGGQAAERAGRDGADRAARDVAAPRGRAPAARGVPRRRRAGRGRQRRRPHLLRVDRQLPAGRAGAAAGRADLRRDRRVPARARGQRRAPARRQRSGVQDHQCVEGGRVIDPLERWAPYGEKPDYAGLLTFAGAPYTQDPAELAGFDVAIVGAPMDDLVSDRPGARFAPRAIRSASCPPGPHLEVKVDAFSALRIVDFGDAPVIPADPAVSHDAIRATVGAVLGAGALPVVLGGDHSITKPAVEAVAEAHGPVGVIHFDTHTDTGAEVFGVERSHGTFMKELLDGGQVVGSGTPRSGCAAIGRGRLSSTGRRSAASPRCSRTTSATSGSATSSAARSTRWGPGRCT